MNDKEMIEKFLCPGCTIGGDTNCGKWKIGDAGDGSVTCESHSAGTFMGGTGRLALGLPKWFAFYGRLIPSSHVTADKPYAYLNIRLWPKNVDGIAAPKMEWGALDLAIWGTEEDGCAIVKTFSPRINKVAIDVCDGLTLAEVPGVTDVRTIEELEGR